MSQQVTTETGRPLPCSQSHKSQMNGHLPLPNDDDDIKLRARGSAARVLTLVPPITATPGVGTGVQTHPQRLYQPGALKGNLGGGQLALTGTNATTTPGGKPGTHQQTLNSQLSLPSQTRQKNRYPYQFTQFPPLPPAFMQGSSTVSPTVAHMQQYSNAPKLKLPHLKTFSAKQDEDLEGWISSLEDHFALAEIPGDKQGKYIGCYLEGNLQTG